MLWQTCTTMSQKYNELREASAYSPPIVFEIDSDHTRAMMELGRWWRAHTHDTHTCSSHTRTHTRLSQTTVRRSTARVRRSVGQTLRWNGHPTGDTRSGQRCGARHQGHCGRSQVRGGYCARTGGRPCLHRPRCRLQQRLHSFTLLLLWVVVDSRCCTICR